MITTRGLPGQRPTLGLLAGLLIGSVLQAADDPVQIREVYWQVLPNVGWVYVDHAGRPWFRTAKGDPAQSIGKEIQQLHYKQELLLGDRKGRLWINSRYRGTVPTKLFDGKNWHDMDVRASKAFEDSAGRVFLAGATHVHVLDGGTWSKKQVAPQPSYTDHFAEDPKGRVWYWGERHISHWGNYPGTRGVWCYDNSKWTNYNRDSGFPYEHVHFLIPLASDRFLVFDTLENRQRKCLFWSPSRKLTAKEQDVFNVLGVKPSGPIFYLGVDLDGFHHLTADGLMPRTADSFSTGGRVVVSPKGEIRLLSKAEAERAKRLPVGLYENKHRIFGRLSDVPPAVPCKPGEAICRDHLGRVYFRRRHGVGVLWPKFEKPGDVIRLQRDAPRVGPLFQAPDGTIWGQGEVPLARWDGRAWADTPVKTLPHPFWSARESPPWRSRAPLVLHGGNTVLAVVMRDIYQDIQAEAKGKKLDHREIRQKVREKGPDARRKWLEAWLYLDGKWTGPEELPPLIDRHWESLATAYAKPPKCAEWFALQGDDRKRLWVAYDSRVSVLDRDGRKEWTMPADPKQRTSGYHLCRLPDGRVLLRQSSGDPGSRDYLHTLRALSIKNAEIVVEDFPEPNWGRSLYSWHPPTAFVAQDKTVWLTMVQRISRHCKVWRLRDNAWEERNDLGEFLFQEKDGSLWFLPGRKHDTLDPKLRGYRVVKGDQTSTFPWPDYPFGKLMPTLDGPLLAACGYWLVELGKADNPLKRTITKARIIDRYMYGPRVFEANDGTIFVAGYRGK